VLGSTTTLPLFCYTLQQQSPFFLFVEVSLFSVSLNSSALYFFTHFSIQIVSVLWIVQQMGIVQISLFQFFALLVANWSMA